MSDKYKSVELESMISDASPHKLIELLIKAARTCIANAIAHIEQNQLKEKNIQLRKAICIIDELKKSLNHEQGGSVADHLDLFYQQIQGLILQATAQNNKNLLAKCNELLATILEAWMNIEPATEKS